MAKELIILRFQRPNMEKVNKGVVELNEERTLPFRVSWFNGRLKFFQGSLQNIQNHRKSYFFHRLFIQVPIVCLFFLLLLSCLTIMPCLFDPLKKLRI